MNGIWEDHALMLEDKLKYAREIVKETELALYKARLKVAGLHDGCMVRSTKTGLVYKFAEMWHWAPYGDGRSWIKAYKMKKDQTWSKSTVNLYGDWEIIKRAPDAAQDDARA